MNYIRKWKFFSISLFSIITKKYKNLTGYCFKKFSINFLYHKQENDRPKTSYYVLLVV